MPTMILALCSWSVCKPGMALRAMPEAEQHLVIAGLLRRLWLLPSAPHPFRPLSALMKHWSEETLASVERWPDVGLAREGLRLFQELPRTAPAEARCWRPTCTQATSFGRRGSRGSSSTKAIDAHASVAKQQQHIAGEIVATQ